MRSPTTTNLLRTRESEIVFRFASPANKRITGSLAHFTAMLHGPIYRPMLGHTAVECGPLGAGPTRGSQAIIFTSARGEHVGYIFELSKQTAPPHRGAWLTDSVIRFEGPQNLKQARSHPSASECCGDHKGTRMDFIT